MTITTVTVWKMVIKLICTRKHHLETKM